MTPATPERGTVLCPEAEKRAAMSDGEFWEYVFNRHAPGPDVEGPDDWQPTTAQLGPCPECGEHGACAYDDQGRALIHVVPDDASEDR